MTIFFFFSKLPNLKDFHIVFAPNAVIVTEILKINFFLNYRSYNGETISILEKISTETGTIIKMDSEIRRENFG